MGIKFDKNLLPSEQKNYLNKTVNIYISQKLGLEILQQKLFSWCDQYSKKCEKHKYLYKGYGIPFDGKGEWRFDNGTARNVIIFGVDNNNNLILTTVRIF